MPVTQKIQIPGQMAIDAQNRIAGIAAADQLMYGTQPRFVGGGPQFGDVR